MSDTLGSEIARRIQEHSSATSQYQRDFEMFDRMYRCIPKERKNISDSAEGPGSLANTFVAEFFRAIETDASAVDALCFVEDPYLTVAPTELSDELALKASVTQATLEKQANGTAWNPRLRTKMLPALRGFCINGTAVARVPWEYRERFASEGDSYVQKALIDSPGFTNISLPRFHFYPHATDIQASPWVAERYPTSRKDVKSLINALKSMPGAVVREDGEVDRILENSSSASSATEGATAAENIRLSRGYTDTSSSVNTKRPILIDYWGEHPEKDTPVDWRILTVNDQWVAMMPNPYSHGMKPYVKASFIELDESFYGLGLGHILKLPQSEINDFRNLMRDMVGLSIHNVWQREGGISGMRKSRMKIRPGMIIDLARDGRMTPLITNLSGIAPAMQLESMTKDDLRGISGATAIQQAVPTDVSAREVSAMGNASDRRIMSLAIVWADRMIRQVFWFWHEMNKQYLTTPLSVNVTNPDGTVSPQMVSGRKMTIDPITGIPQYASDLLDDADIDLKVPTDGDGRKGMARRVNSSLETLLNAQERVPDIKIDFVPIIRELARLMGIAPLSIVQRVQPPMMPPMGGPVAPPAPAEEAGTPPVGPIPPPMNLSGAVSEGLTPVPTTLPSQAPQIGGIVPTNA